MCNMKRATKILLSVLSICLIAGIFSTSSASLKVYRLNGNVSVQTKSGSKKLARRDELSQSDIVTVPKGGYIEILDSKTHRIYTSNRAGKSSVKKIMETAEADAAGVTRRTNKKVLDAIAENAATKKNSFAVGGISIHETDAVVHAPIACPDSISYLAFLMQIDRNTDTEDSFDIILMQRETVDNDDSFNFAVFNTLSKPLYFNVIDINSGEDASLYFPGNPIARPKKETIIQEYRFAQDDDTDGYIVIASDKDFTAEDVKMLFRPGYEPEEDYYFSLLLKHPNE